MNQARGQPVEIGVRVERLIATGKLQEGGKEPPGYVLPPALAGVAGWPAVEGDPLTNGPQ